MALPPPELLGGRGSNEHVVLRSMRGVEGGEEERWTYEDRPPQEMAPTHSTIAPPSTFQLLAFQKTKQNGTVLPLCRIGEGCPLCCCIISQFCEIALQGNNLPIRVYLEKQRERWVMKILSLGTYVLCRE